MTSASSAPVLLALVPVTIEVNGERLMLEVPPTRRLLGVLRDELALTGAKLGCGEGACGACAVLLDGAPVASCLLPVGCRRGPVGDDDRGSRRSAASCRRRSWRRTLQCGFCTPGQIVSATALLAATRPTRDEIRAAMAGNLCRCGAYPKIERAILAPRARRSR